MNNNMMCDLQTGICGDAGEQEMGIIDFSEPQEKLDLYYVTDPICSHCWALEPVMLRFQAQYGQYFRFHTVMGGMLPNWDGFADVSNGINGPADVAGHWREVGEHSRMPIDGTLWLDNPVQSSFPPSRVYKVIQKHDEKLANTYLRRAREALFAFNQNISDDQVLIDIVNKLGLDGKAIIEEAHLTASQELLNEDFMLASKLGVRGFPTIIMINEEKKGVKIVGARQLDDYVDALQQLLTSTDTPEAKAQPSLSKLLNQEGLLFSKEIELMYDLNQSEALAYIQSQLNAEQYEQKEILGEAYFTNK